MKRSQKMRLIWSFFRDERKKIAAVMCMSALSAGIGALSPSLTGRVIDALPRHDYRALLELTLIITIISVLAAAGGFAVSAIAVGIQERTAYRMRLDLIRGLQRASMSKIEEMEGGEATTRLTSDVDALVGAIQNSMLSVLSALLTLVAASIAMIFIHPLIAGVSICFIIVTLPLLRSVGSRMSALRLGLSRSQDAFANFLQERMSVRGAAITKTHARTDLDFLFFGKLVGAVRDLNLARAKMTRRFQFTISLIAACGPTAILLYGGWLVTKGEMSVGALVALLGLQGRLFGPAMLLANVHVQLATVSALFDRALEVLEYPEEQRGSTEVHGHKFSLRSVSVVKNARVLLDDISMDLSGEGIVGIVGASGAGKSTLANLILGLESASNGLVAVDSIDMNKITDASLRKTIAASWGDGFLFSDTLLANVTYGTPQCSHENVRMAIEIVGLTDLVASLPSGIHEHVGFHGSRLSLGERQRVGIARALVRNTPVLILDEATSGLPLRDEARLFDSILRDSSVKTLIVVTHRLQSLRNAVDIVVLEDGRIAEHGTHGELLARNGAFGSLIGSLEARSIA